MERTELVEKVVIVPEQPTPRERMYLSNIDLSLVVYQDSSSFFDPPSNQFYFSEIFSKLYNALGHLDVPKLPNTIFTDKSFVFCILIFLINSLAQIPVFGKQRRDSQYFLTGLSISSKGPKFVIEASQRLYLRLHSSSTSLKSLSIKEAEDLKKKQQDSDIFLCQNSVMSNSAKH
ncbi:transferase family protein [Medicago truncatula]|uniref:Transferase family protein n=1 Tax=Medicago truncatula TaxID=3880 RepID=A0A072TYU7_MEDTR|nr:transferase family protein [Medicago truncatula]